MFGRIGKITGKVIICDSVNGNYICSSDASSIELEELEEVRETINPTEFHLNGSIFSDMESIKNLFGTISHYKYPTPPYREKLHPQKFVLSQRCRIRNRQNSGHKFK